jgi:hypothetical protein
MYLISFFMYAFAVCAPGYGGVPCVLCAKGFWSAGGGTASCTDCGAGLTTTKVTGAIAAADCDGKVSSANEMTNTSSARLSAVCAANFVGFPCCNCCGCFVSGCAHFSFNSNPSSACTRHFTYVYCTDATVPTTCLAPFRSMPAWLPWRQLRKVRHQQVWQR